MMLLLLLLLNVGGGVVVVGGGGGDGGGGGGGFTSFMCLYVYVHSLARTSTVHATAARSLLIGQRILSLTNMFRVESET